MAADELEPHVLSVLQAGLAQATLAEQISELNDLASEDAADLAGERASVEAAIERANDLLVDGTLTRAVYDKQRTRLARRLAEIDGRAAVVAKRDVAERRASLFEEYLERQDYLNDPAAFDWWRALIEETVQYVEVPVEGRPVMGMRDTVTLATS